MSNLTPHACCNKREVKLGAWSHEEDEILKNYILANDHGKWTTLPQRAGLQRCGKSCRLRWLNYLRPDLKHGPFSKDEARLIVELHELVGNKWSYIATHLPGRTDNDIKNLWNSTLKNTVLASQQQQQLQLQQQQQQLQLQQQQQQQQQLQQHLRQIQQQFHENLFHSLKQRFYDSAADRLVSSDREWLSLAPPCSSRKGKEVAED